LIPTNNAFYKITIPTSITHQKRYNDLRYFFVCPRVVRTLSSYQVKTFQKFQMRLNGYIMLGKWVIRHFENKIIDNTEVI
jgi:hypothetical protein